MVDRPDERPEIEPYFWDINNLKWPVNGKIKPDLIIFDPPYFRKKPKNMKKTASRIFQERNTKIFLRGSLDWQMRTAKKAQDL